MATKKTQDALTPANDNGAALATTSDELEGLDLSDYNDGLDDLDRDDMKIPAYSFNMKGQGKDGKSIPKDVFYDTVEELQISEVDAVFCLLKKTNVFAVYDSNEDKTEIRCSSFDRVTGTVFGACKGCEHTKWYEEKDDKGVTHKKRNCSVTYNVFAVDRTRNQPFLVRFKRTSLPPFQQYLQKHHAGKRLIKGERHDYPLFVFHAKLSLKMANPKANYAVPVIEKVGPLTNEEIRLHAENTKALVPHLRIILERADARDAASDAGADTSFDPAKFGGSEGEDFVESSAG